MVTAKIAIAAEKVGGRTLHSLVFCFINRGIRI